MLAFYICLTRISDYKHHPGDVLAGVFVGAFFAILILIFLMDLFNRPRMFKYESCMDIDFIDDGGGQVKEDNEGHFQLHSQNSVEQKENV